MKKLTRIAFAAAFGAAAILVSCSKTEPSDPLSGHKLVPVDVTLDISNAMDEATKATTALFPEVENWIFDYYYVQFNSAGISITSGHRRAEVTVGDLSATDQVWLWDVGQSTVTYVANIMPAGVDYDDDPLWQQGATIKIADNIETYKTVKFDMSKRLAAVEDGSLKHTPMCGYWEGSITTANNSEADPFHMTVTLGRMIVKMRISFTNSTGSAINKVALNNAASKAYIYPQVENTPLEADDYITLSHDISVAHQASGTVYFYTAPNFCGQKTTLEFTTASGKTGSIALGADIDGGDYNLYMNTIYTYTLTLK